MLDPISFAETIVTGTKYALYLFSVITWTLILLKLWQFSRNNSDNRQFNDTFWNAANLIEAEQLLSHCRGAQARIALQGCNWLKESKQAAGKSLKYQGTVEELLEHALLVQMQQEQHRLENGLTMLASIGSTAPFVGLFGTVVGIMHAMHQITASGSTSLEVVAGPIGDALIATAIGIAVAVPAVLAYNFFLRRAKHQRTHLENFVLSFMHIALSNNKAGA